jgi:hypothetical protein
MAAAVVNYTVFVKEAAAGITTQGLRGADCNGDGNRTSEDVTRLLQYIAKMIPEI